MTLRSAAPLTLAAGLFLLGPSTGLSQEPEPAAGSETPTETPTDPAATPADDGAASGDAALGPVGRLQQEIDVLGIQAQSALDEAGAVDTDSEQVAALVTELEGLADRARRVRRIRSVEELEALRDNLLDRSLALHQALGEARQETQATPAPSTAPTTPAPQPSPQATDTLVPEALRATARAYFTADYEGTLRAAESDVLERPADRALVALFSAAARYAQYLKSGGEDATLLDAARADVAACRSLDPDLAPASNAFSPRFVEFFAAEGP